MSNSPLVTVVIPVFNSAAFVGEAIASIRNQTIDDWELIVIDDGSTDHSVAAVREAAGDDPRIRLILFDRNQGISTAVNAGFDAARGEFIARLDADDRAMPQRLAAQVAAFRAWDALAAAGGHASVFGDVPDGIAYCRRGSANIKAYLLDGMNTIGGGTLMVRSAFVREHRIRFDEAAESAEDLTYLTQIMEAGGELENVDEAVIACRRHAGSFTRSRIDTARVSLQAMRRRLLAVWYPQLDARDIELIVDTFHGVYPGHIGAFLEYVRAADRLITDRPVDLGQDVSTVHAIVLDRLQKVAVVYCDHGLLDASHVAAIRCFTAPATGAIFERLGF